MVIAAPTEVNHATRSSPPTGGVGRARPVRAVATSPRTGCDQEQVRATDEGQIRLDPDLFDHLPVVRRARHRVHTSHVRRPDREKRLLPRGCAHAHSHFSALPCPCAVRGRRRVADRSRLLRGRGGGEPRLDHHRPALPPGRRRRSLSQHGPGRVPYPCHADGREGRGPADAVAVSRPPGGHAPYRGQHACGGSRLYAKYGAWEKVTDASMRTSYAVDRELSLEYRPCPV